MTEILVVEVGSLMMGLLVTALIVAILSAGGMRKSKKYRKFLTDMYVAAKIRFLAGEDGLKIEDENENYKAWCKKQRVSNREYDLDNTVEEELKERVGTPKKSTKTKTQVPKN